VQPGGESPKLNTFAAKLAEDPLFMLPKGIESPWREREIKRMMEGSHNNKDNEEYGFPGVSLKKKVFSVPKSVQKPRARPPPQDTRPNRASEMPRPAREPKLDADERPVVGRLKGKERKKYKESQMVDPASGTMPTADLPDASRPTAPRRKSAPANVVDIPPLTSSISQPTASGIQDNGLKTVAVNVGSVRLFEELVRRYNSSAIAQNSATVPEGLVEELEKLGIKSNLPQWKVGKKK
jgi:hypothetical protein